jgi:hypothetical protein
LSRWLEKNCPFFLGLWLNRSIADDFEESRLQQPPLLLISTASLAVFSIGYQGSRLSGLGRVSSERATVQLW